MATRNTLRFLSRGRVIELAAVPPMRTVLEYLRLDERACGTKEGCNEGDCGACTVAVGSLKDGRLVYEPVNACILLLAQLEGRELVTVEDLSAGGALHPVQRAMADAHAAQCGFCTPGFVMSLFTLYHQQAPVTRQRVVDHLAGNLCRCTGYRPIVDAALAVCQGTPDDAWASRAAETTAALAALRSPDDVFIGDAKSFTAVPSTRAGVAQLALEHPDAVIVSGATDVGLWITKQLRSLPKIIHVSHVDDLHRIEETATALSLGAAATFAEAMPALARLDPDIGETLRRIGSTQVRASGSVGGNIANGSPIGDSPPLLIALGATLVLRHGDRERRLPLEEYFIAYGKQDRAPGELVWRVDIPRLKPGERFRAYKISKRFDQDISAVMAAFKITLEGDNIAAARIAFGGMAATPKRAARAEAALRGAQLSRPDSWSAAIAALDSDFQPLSDMRASAGYRGEVARNLLRKALMELAGADEPSRVVGDRGEAA